MQSLYKSSALEEEAADLKGLFWLLDDEALRLSRDEPRDSETAAKEPSVGGEGKSPDAVAERERAEEAFVVRLAQTHRILSRLERQQHHSAAVGGAGGGGSGSATRAMKRLKDAPKLFLLNHAGGTNPVIYNVAEWLSTCREPSNTDAALELAKLTKRCALCTAFQFTQVDMCE